MVTSTTIATPRHRLFGLPKGTSVTIALVTVAFGVWSAAEMHRWSAAWGDGWLAELVNNGFAAGLGIVCAFGILVTVAVVFKTRRPLWQKLAVPVVFVLLTIAAYRWAVPPTNLYASLVPADYTHAADVNAGVRAMWLDNAVAYVFAPLFVVMAVRRAWRRRQDGKQSQQ